MPEPPYDRPLALASLVRTMRDHYLAVRCGCGAERVIAIARMADNSRLADYTLAHVAMTLRCEGCHDGPDEVHLAATVHGLRPASGAETWYGPCRWWCGTAAGRSDGTR